LKSEKNVKYVFSNIGGIGVASYGAGVLGHVPPRLSFFQLFNFSRHLRLRAAQTLTFDSMWFSVQ